MEPTWECGSSILPCMAEPHCCAGLGDACALPVRALLEGQVQDFGQIGAKHAKHAQMTNEQVTARSSSRLAGTL